jgi:membrane dipeptidase
MLALILASALAAVPAQENVQQRFERLMRDILIVDTHIDTPGYIVDEGYKLGEEHNYYEFDIPRAQRGHLGAVFFGVYAQPGDFPECLWIPRALEWIDGLR